MRKKLELKKFAKKVLRNCDTAVVKTSLSVVLGQKTFFYNKKRVFTVYRERGAETNSAIDTGDFQKFQLEGRYVQCYTVGVA